MFLRQEVMGSATLDAQDGIPGQGHPFPVRGVPMEEDDAILLSLAVGALGQAQEILTELVNRGALPTSWGEIASVLALVRSDLTDVESGMTGEIAAMGASFG